jgi:hypothetical protein
MLECRSRPNLSNGFSDKSLVNVTVVECGLVFCDFFQYIYSKKKGTKLIYNIFFLRLFVNIF